MAEISVRAGVVCGNEVGLIRTYPEAGLGCPSSIKTRLSDWLKYPGNQGPSEPVARFCEVASVNADMRTGPGKSRAISPNAAKEVRFKTLDGRSLTGL